MKPGTPPRARSASVAALALAAALAVSACAAPAAATPVPTAAAPSPSTGVPASGRLSSPAVVRIVSPAQGAVVTGPNVHIVVAVDNATVVQATTTNVTPDTGHVHLYLDNALTYMAYGLQQDLPVTTGTYVLKAEFVAADHVPFNPRVWSDQIVFTVP